MFNRMYYKYMGPLRSGDSTNDCHFLAQFKYASCITATSSHKAERETVKAWSGRNSWEQSVATQAVA